MQAWRPWPDFSFNEELSVVQTSTLYIFSTSLISYGIAMEKRLDDIYKEIQESLLAGKAKLVNNNDDNDKKYEDRNTIKYMFLNPRAIKEMERNPIDDTARLVDEWKNIRQHEFWVTVYSRLEYDS